RMRPTTRANYSANSRLPTTRPARSRSPRNCSTSSAVRQHWRSNLARFDAVIFDMDGVLVDGEPLHFAAVNQLLAEEGRSISLVDYMPYLGTKSGWRDLIRVFGLQGDVARYEERYLPLLVQAYRERSVALPGAVELVRALKGRIPL